MKKSAILILTILISGLVFSSFATLITKDQLFAGLTSCFGLFVSLVGGLCCDPIQISNPIKNAINDPDPKGMFMEILKLVFTPKEDSILLRTLKIAAFLGGMINVAGVFVAYHIMFFSHSNPSAGLEIVVLATAFMINFGASFLLGTIVSFPYLRPKT